CRNTWPTQDVPAPPASRIAAGLFFVVWASARIRRHRLVRRRVRRPSGAVRSIARAPNQGSRPTCRARADRKAGRAARHHGLPSLLTLPPRLDSQPQLARRRFLSARAARPNFAVSFATSLALKCAQKKFTPGGAD